MKSLGTGVQSWEVEGEVGPYRQLESLGQAVPGSWIQAWAFCIAGASKVSALLLSVSWVFPPDL